MLLRHVPSDLMFVIFGMLFVAEEVPTSRRAEPYGTNLVYCSGRLFQVFSLMVSKRWRAIACCARFHSHPVTTPMLGFIRQFISISTVHIGTLPLATRWVGGDVTNVLFNRATHLDMHFASGTNLLQQVIDGIIFGSPVYLTLRSMTIPVDVALRNAKRIKAMIKKRPDIMINGVSASTCCKCKQSVLKLIRATPKTMCNACCDE